MTIRLTALAAILSASLAAHADTILNSNIGGGYYDSFNSYQVFGESFTTSQAYYNSSISVYLEGPSTSSGTAYLTTSIGPGTTPADQIAAIAFTPNSTSYTLQTLFTGVTLPAGTIYLTLAASNTTSGMLLEADYPTSVTTAPGVTFNSDYLASTSAAYPPASSIGGLGGDFGSVITGTALAPTPEPSSLILLGTGVLGLAGMVRKRLA